jgi:general secretion pathway protein K
VTAPGAKDAGSAVIAAVLASACFALLAAQMVDTSRSELRSVNAGIVHAHLAAADDAGLAIAINGLTTQGPSGHWDIDQTAHVVDFDHAQLTITVEDERGKIALNTVTEPQLRVLFSKAGAAPETVTDLVNAFLDFRDPTRVRTNGSSPASPLAAAREGGLRTVEELAQIPGMTPALYAAILPVVTVNSGDKPFDESTASPLALEVMAASSGTAGGVRTIERQRERAGERTALSTDNKTDLAGRALTIRVVAVDDKDGRAEKATIIELTGHSERPYVVRQQNASIA